MADDTIHYFIEGALGLTALISDKIFDRKADSKVDTKLDRLQDKLHAHQQIVADTFAHKSDVTRSIENLTNKVDQGFQNINNNILRVIADLKSKDN